MIKPPPPESQRKKIIEKKRNIMQKEIHCHSAKTVLKKREKGNYIENLLMLFVCTLPPSAQCHALYKFLFKIQLYNHSFWVTQYEIEKVKNLGVSCSYHFQKDFSKNKLFKNYHLPGKASSSKTN